MSASRPQQTPAGAESQDQFGEAQQRPLSDNAPTGSSDWKQGVPISESKKTLIPRNQSVIEGDGQTLSSSAGKPLVGRSSSCTRYHFVQRRNIVSKARQELKPDGTIKRVYSAPQGISETDEEMGGGNKIVIGVCAMDKKANSKPMQAIMKRLLAYNEFEIVLFGDDIIRDHPWEEWPVCDCLLSWFSEGFPLKKAQQYVAARKPYLVNDIFFQDVLLDRRKVYRTLQDAGIPVPHHIIVDRDVPMEGTDPPGFVETEDYVELNGVRVEKPFVEKPANGEDHNIHIYYPHSMGGGVKRLFRKIGNKSGDYDPQHPGTVRRDGSYIYEEFLTTGGTDVKVYTVGPRYAHAEARKSPVVDGKVKRTKDGKEERFPVLLNPQEKEIARMVVLAFGQKVCGFDLLRCDNGKTYVCDVNGWSFVKNSHKYYDDAAGIIRGIVTSALAPHHLLSTPQPHSHNCDWAPVSHDDGLPGQWMMSSPMGDDPHVSGSMRHSASAEDLMGADELGVQWEELHQWEELRCVLAVIRHGDRTPKQKLKMAVTQPQILALWERHKDAKGKQAKLKSPQELQELLDATRDLLSTMEERRDAAGQTLKPPQQGTWNAANAGGGSGGGGGGGNGDGGGASMVGGGGVGGAAGDQGVVGGGVGGAALAPPSGLSDYDEVREKFRIVKTVLEQGGSFAGINRKVQLKPLKWEECPPETKPADRKVTELLLILKHGGVLTHAGRAQAEALGQEFRTSMYPRFGPGGGGLLRLHSTYRHDLKIYSSDEGRVQSSAAAFTQGLLDLEGTSLTPILVSLVKKDVAMLDAFGKGAEEDMRHAKELLYNTMTWDEASGTSLCKAQHAHVTPPSREVSTDVEYVAGHKTPSSGVSPPDTSTQNPLASSISQLSLNSSTGGPVGFDPHTTLSQQQHAQQLAQQMSGNTIPHMPDHPLRLLRGVAAQMKEVVERLRQMCLDERVDPATRGGEDGTRGYSALLQAPSEWKQPEPMQPCSYERLLLMFDRWRKLLKAFFSEKKNQFDISKVPDIYDAVKYDAIHNSHLGLPLKELYQNAKALADTVIPNEYGVTARTRLHIGSAVCAQLLGKILADMNNMREESLATAGINEQVDPNMMATADGQGLVDINTSEMHPGMHPGLSRTDTSGSGVNGGELEEGEDQVLHRLCPAYAQDVNSPLRHVRTRIYYTSESHMHSLVNVLRFCHVGRGDSSSVASARSSVTGEPHPPAGVADNNDSYNDGGGGGGGAMYREGSGLASDNNSGRSTAMGEAAAAAAVPTPLPSAFHNAPASSAASAAAAATGPSAEGGGSAPCVASPQEGGGAGGGSGCMPLSGPSPGMLSDQAQRMLDCIPELDYQTHLVFRLIENKRVAVDHPERFRVELLFSPGHNGNPTTVVPPKGDHTLPLAPRVPLHPGAGVQWNTLQRMLKPYAARMKASTYPSTWTLPHFNKGSASSLATTATDISRPVAPLFQTPQQP